MLYVICIHVLNCWLSPGQILRKHYNNIVQYKIRIIIIIMESKYIAIAEIENT